MVMMRILLVVEPLLEEEAALEVAEEVALLEEGPRIANMGLKVQLPRGEAKL